MARETKLNPNGITIKNASICVSCGGEGRLNQDHFLPRALVSASGFRSESIAHPVRLPVLQNANIFPLHREPCHPEIDRDKISAFLGLDIATSLNHDRAWWDITRGDPVSLMSFLKNNYPVTDNERFHDKQLYCMDVSLQLFEKAVGRLDDEFLSMIDSIYKTNERHTQVIEAAQVLVTGYHNSLSISERFRENLRAQEWVPGAIEAMGVPISWDEKPKIQARYHRFMRRTSLKPVEERREQFFLVAAALMSAA